MVIRAVITTRKLQACTGEATTRHNTSRTNIQMGFLSLLETLIGLTSGLFLQNFISMLIFPVEVKINWTLSNTDAYQTFPTPHFGQSAHISLLLNPVYRPVINKVRLSIRMVQMWPEGALSQLQDCNRTHNEEMQALRNTHPQCLHTLTFVLTTCLLTNTFVSSPEGLDGQ